MKSKAWQILNKDEKTALMLTFNQKKSSWEAGDIMDKSHYKYLEITYINIAIYFQTWYLYIFSSFIKKIKYSEFSG